MSESKTEHVHFSIDAEGFTYHVRHVWVSDNPIHAIKTMREGLRNDDGWMPLDLALGVINGEYKFVNEGNEIVLTEEEEVISINDRFGGDFDTVRMRKRLERNLRDDFDSISAYEYLKEQEPESLEYYNGLIAGKRRTIEELSAQLQFLYTLPGNEDASFAELISSLSSSLSRNTNPNTWDWNEFTDEAMDVWCERNGRSLPQSKGQENYYIENFGDEIKKIEEEIEENARVERIKGKVKESVDEYNRLVDEFHADMEGVIIGSSEQYEVWSGLVELAKQTNETARLHGVKVGRKHFRTLMPFPIDPEVHPVQDAYILPDGRIFRTHVQGHNDLEDLILNCGVIDVPRWTYNGFGIDWSAAGFIKISYYEVMRGLTNEVAYLEEWEHPFPEAQREALLRVLLSEHVHENGEPYEYRWWGIGGGLEKEIKDPLQLVQGMVQDYDRELNDSTKERLKNLKNEQGE